MLPVEIHHVALSVRDIDRSAAWYERLFELEKVAELDEPAPMRIYMTPRGQAIDLRQDPRAGTEPFTQERTGLDHVGFVCGDRVELEKWQARLDEFGVESSGIVESPFGWHVNFRDPDEIALEFFLPRSER
jgi:catechol 2,3-dioxygenase-like lactoylglutathione lyase family enzyme